MTVLLAIVWLVVRVGFSEVVLLLLLAEFLCYLQSPGSLDDLAKGYSNETSVKVREA